MNWDTIYNEWQVMIQSILAFVITFAVVYHHYFSVGSRYPFFRNSGNGTGTKGKASSVVSCCKNPNCIRCQRYRHVQERAKSKLRWILWDLKAKDPSAGSSLSSRIPDAITQSGSDFSSSSSSSPLQDPTVLMVSDLPSREIVTDWHRNACEYLQQRQIRSIVSEALHSLGAGRIIHETKTNTVEPSDGRSLVASSNDDDSKSWTVNDTSPEGDWRVFQILNQGVWNPKLLGGNAPCRQLVELVENIPGLLNHCLFGNAFVSKIYPGTIIEPHCGPTNIRHRLQFLLKLPEPSPFHAASGGNAAADEPPVLSLSVGREENIQWDMQKDTFVFDDSFVHSVTYRGKEAGRDGFTTETPVGNAQEQTPISKDFLARMVLIVDLWHPGLQDIERKMLQDLFPPYSE